MSTEVKNLNRSSWAITIGASALVLIIMISINQLETSGYPYAVGKYIVYAAAASLLVYYATLKQYGNQAFIILYITIFTSMMAGYSYHHETQRSEALKLFDNLLDIQQQVLENSYDEEGVAIINNIPITQTSNATGTLKEIEHLFQRITQTEIDLSNDYLQELHNAGIITLLDTNALLLEGGPAKSLENIPKLYETIKKHRTIYFDFFDGIPDIVRKTTLPPSTQEQVIIGFKKTFNIKRRLITKNWNSETDIIGTYESMLKILEAEFGAWKVENGQILFDNDLAVEKYNKLIETFTQLSADQENTLQELLDINQNVIESAKKKLK